MIESEYITLKNFEMDISEILYKVSNGEVILPEDINYIKDRLLQVEGDIRSIDGVKFLNSIKYNIFQIINNI